MSRRDKVKWKQPETAKPKFSVTDLELSLTSINDKLSQHRIRVAKHYKLTWRLGVGLLGAVLFLQMFLVSTPTWVPIWSLVLFLMSFPLQALHAWPADISWPYRERAELCTCSLCKEPKEDLR